jgi:hypothetical protein
MSWFCRSDRARADGPLRRTGREQEVPMHARIANYRLSGDAHELARKAEEGLLPIYRAQPGFVALNVVASEDMLTSASAWETSEQAEAATPAIAEWVADNIADDIELIDIRYGEILIATALGVSALAATKA